MNGDGSMDPININKKEGGKFKQISIFRLSKYKWESYVFLTYNIFYEKKLRFCLIRKTLLSLCMLYI